MSHEKEKAACGSVIDIDNRAKDCPALSEKDTEYSQNIKLFRREREKAYQKLYDQMAEQKELSPNERKQLQEDVAHEVNRLEQAKREYFKAYWWAGEHADELRTRLKEGKSSEAKRRLLRRAPANSVIDYEERRKHNFAAGMNFYKIALICFAGSFAGVIVEMLWCLITKGYLESRAGLVYGPFNLLYGVGAVAITRMLYAYRNRSTLYSFVGGMLVGSAVEYVLSWAQELAFGSVSWDYSHMPFNINGRICLLYSVFWGVLGVFWIKSLYPRLAKWILKIPNDIGKTVTIALCIVFAIDATVSVIAVDRWSHRIYGDAPQSAFGACIDEIFPDERMERIYANMHFFAERGNDGGQAEEKLPSE